LLADDHGHLADPVLWVLRVGATERYVLPGKRSGSRLAPMIQNLAAAATFSGWSNQAPSWKPPTGSTSKRAERSTGPARVPPPEVVNTVTVRANRRASSFHQTTSTSNSPHVRRAHWHRYRVGPRDNWKYEFRWLAPMWVGGQPPPDRPDKVYVVPTLPAWAPKLA
jgi:hypothetical protein